MPSFLIVNRCVMVTTWHMSIGRGEFRLARSVGPLVIRCALLIVNRCVMVTPWHMSIGRGELRLARSVGPLGVGCV